MSSLEGLRICFLAGTLGQGGAERQLFYSLQALKREGAIPSVLCLSKGEFWEESIKSLNIQVVWVGNHKTRIGRIAQIIQELRQLSPHIFQAQHFYVNLYVALAARWLRIVEIGTIRSNGINDVSETGRFWGTLSSRIPRRIVSNSYAAINNMERIKGGGTKLYYLPNVVDTQKFVPGKKVACDSLHVLMVGRLAQPKRFDAFLSLISMAKKWGKKDIVGHIVGDGPDRLPLENLATELGLFPSNIQFHGSVRNVEKLYKRADICVHLSDWEGLPNTLLEAMASGLPVIASNVGGIPEIVQHRETGLLIDPNDQTAAFEALIAMASDSNSRVAMGNAGRQFVEQTHSLDQLSSFFEPFYERILNE